MKKGQAVLAGLGIGLLAWVLDQLRNAAPTNYGGSSTGDVAYLERVGFVDTAAKWLSDLRTRGAAYIGMFSSTETQYRLPNGLLSRVAWQESRYRADIITGQTISKVGAIGIMQFMPATAQWLGIDPTDPAQAIDGAGRYLARLYGQFHDWSHALMAYNWGPGNVSAWLTGRKTLPPSVRAYSDEILSDLGLK